MSTVNELVAWARAEFPNTRLSDKELRAMADKALDNPLTELEQVHKVCPECGFKWTGPVFRSPPLAKFAPRYDEDGRAVQWCDRCVDAWERRVHAKREKAPQYRPTPAVRLLPPDEVERDYE